MAGRNIGRVEFTVDYDGDGLVPKAKKLGREAGQAAGDGFQNSFSASFSDLGKRLSRDLKSKGKFSDILFSKAEANQIRGRLQGLTSDLAKVFVDKKGLDNYAEGFDTIGEASQRLRADLNELSKNGVVTDKRLGALLSRVEKWEGPANAAREATRAFNAEIRKMADAQSEAIKMNDEFDRMAREIDLAHKQAIKLNEGINLKEARIDAREFSAEIRALTRDTEESNRLFEQNSKGVASFREEIARAHGEAIKMDIAFDRQAESARLAALQIDRSGSAYNRLRSAISSLDKPSGDFFARWKDLPRGFRRLAFFTGLFAALGTSIAVLGSVAGSSLAVLATALTAVGVAGLVGAVGFSGILGPLNELGPNAAAASVQLRAIGSAFAALQGGIQENLFAGLADSFSRVAGIAPQIQGALNLVATSLGGVIKGFADAISSARGIEVINALLTGFGPIISLLGTALQQFGSALGTIFVAALPATQTFAAGLADIATRFSTFLQSAEGQTALTNFFTTLQTVMPPLLALIGATGSALASLVTPTTIGLLNQTLGYLTQFMPALAGFINILGILDPIGLIAQLLAQVGTALSPLGPQFATLAATLNTLLSGVFTALAPILAQVAGAFLQVAQPLVEALIPAFETLAPIIADLVRTVLPPLVEAFLNLIPLIPIFVGLLQDIFAPEQLVLIGEMLYELADLVPLVVDGISNLLSSFVELNKGSPLEAFEALVLAVLPFLRLFPDISDAIEDAFGGIEAFLAPVGVAFEGLVAIVSGVVGNITGFFSGLAAGVIGFFAPIIDIVVSVFTGIISIVSSIIGAVAQIFVGLVQIVLAVMGGIGEKIGQFFQPLVSLVSGIISSVVNFFSQMVANIIAFVSPIAARVGAFFQPIVSFVSGVVGQVVGFWSGIIGRITGFVSGIAESVGGFFQQIPDKIKGVVDKIVGFFRDLPGRVLSAVGNIASDVSARLGLNIKLPFTASGGVFGGAQARIIGEAGPEAVVPLDRPLSQVDPAVRALSAFAQGLSVPGGQRSGDSYDSSKSVVIADGAIRVSSPAPQYAGEQVFDMLVNEL